MECHSGTKFLPLVSAGNRHEVVTQVSHLDLRPVHMNPVDRAEPVKRDLALSLFPAL